MNNRIKVLFKEKIGIKEAPQHTISMQDSIKK